MSASRFRPFKFLWKPHLKRYNFIRRIVDILLTGLTILIIILLIWHYDFKIAIPVNEVNLESVKLCLEVGLLFLTGLFAIVRLIDYRFGDPMLHFFRTEVEISDLSMTGHTTHPDRKTVEQGIESNIEPEQKSISGYSVIDNLELDDIRIVHRIAENAWGMQEGLESTNTYELYRRWFLANPKVFSLICHDNMHVGYICLLPIVNAKHFDQKIDKQYIDYDLMNTFLHSSAYLFIENIYLEKKYQNDREAQLLIYRELFKKIDLFAARNKEVTLYATPQYYAFKAWLLRLGFKEYFNTRKSNNVRCQLALQPKKTVSNEEEFQPFENLDFKSDLLIVSYNKFVKKLYDERENDLDRHRTMDGVPFVQDINEFFGRSFANIDDEEVIRTFQGKMFPFYTHATYKPDRLLTHSTNHFLGVSYISFSNDFKSKFISCKFYTGTKNHNKAYVFNGVCMFSKDCRDILMIFHPQKSYDQRNRAADRGILGDAPLVITGKILELGESDFIADQPDDRLLSLNMTTYSQHYGSTVSKIGVLHLKALPEHKNKMPSPLFEPLDIMDTDPDIKKTIKLYLMRSTKVIIKGLDRRVVNKKSDIDRWLSDTYQPLKNYLGRQLELYYYKKADTDHALLDAAFVEFLPNGIARLTRQYTGKQKENQPIKEQYFGEINIRYNENHKKFLYIKFIQLGNTEGNNLDVMNQRFRELFLILFWPEDDYRFDYTRGIILGDRDVSEASNDSIMSSNICVLCDPNDVWNNRFNENGNYNNSLESLYNTKRLTDIGANFIDNIVNNTVSNTFKDKFTKSYDEQQMMNRMLSFNEIYFDKMKCHYAFKA